MNYIRLFLLIFPLTISASTSASSTKNDIDDPGTGTFPLSDRYSQPQQMEAEKEQLEMEKKDTDKKLNGWGEDKYNENVDPDDLKPEK